MHQLNVIKTVSNWFLDMILQVEEELVLRKVHYVVTSYPIYFRLNLLLVLMGLNLLPLPTKNNVHSGRDGLLDVAVTLKCFLIKSVSSLL